MHVSQRSVRPRLLITRRQHTRVHTHSFCSSWVPTEPGPGCRLARLLRAWIRVQGQVAVPCSPRVQRSPLEQEDGDDDKDDEDDCQDGACHPQHLGLLLLLRWCHLDHNLIRVGAGGIALLRLRNGTGSELSVRLPPPPCPPNPENGLGGWAVLAGRDWSPIPNSLVSCVGP